MKKNVILIVVILSMSLLTACDGKEDTSVSSEPAPVREENTVVETSFKPDAADDIKVISDIDENASDGEDFSEAEETYTEENKEPVADEAATEAVEEDAKPDEGKEEEKKSGAQPIVWLGDSLTQGSLGEDEDNLANAPYVRLAKKVSVPVEGYGLFGFNTNDIFRAYTSPKELGQTIDPNKTYILWVGSNDWVAFGDPNADTGHVMERIDQFLAEKGGIKQYIVMGTTSRYKLGDLYIPINQDLAAHYGVHYMDVIDIINQYGYSPDNTHLSQASYDAIADAVYAKLKAMGYI